ncbi:MAG: 2Fe-2S iron-sulfur cluster-binding protein, partial [Gammaproteobacteria bacterium]
ACTVLLDGAPVRSCGIAVATLDAAQDITTIEGLPGATRDPVQRAWAALSVAQCGYCQSGMVLQASALLAETPAPSDAEIDRYMTNLCRCGSYQLVRAAIRQAANAIGEGDAHG